MQYVYVSVHMDESYAFSHLLHHMIFTFALSPSRADDASLDQQCVWHAHQLNV